MVQDKAKTVIAWQDNGRIKVLDLNKKETSEIGSGVSPRVYLLNNGKAICVWEDNEKVRYKVI